MDKPTLFQQPTVGVGAAIIRAVLLAPDETRDAVLATLEPEMLARVRAWVAANARGSKP